MPNVSQELLRSYPANQRKVRRNFTGSSPRPFTSEQKNCERFIKMNGHICERNFGRHAGVECGLAEFRRNFPSNSLSPIAGDIAKVDAGMAADTMCLNHGTTCRSALTRRVRQRRCRRCLDNCNSISHRRDGERPHRPMPRQPSRNSPPLLAISRAVKPPPTFAAASASSTRWGCPSSARAAARSTTALTSTSACNRISAEGGPGRRLYGP